jgi:hypothetical protein
MSFNLAEARLQTIKKLQVQADKWKKYCGKAEDRLDKEMKLNEDLQEENKKLLKEISRLEDRAVADYDTRMKEYKQLKEENASLRCREMAHMTQEQIIRSHEWIEWKEYKEHCIRHMRRVKQVNETNTKHSLNYP